MKRIGIIGGGQMGEALLAGFIKGGVESQAIAIVEQNKQRAEVLRSRYAVLVTDIMNVTESSDYLFIAVKPKDVRSIIQELAEITANLDTEVVVVSIAAGIPTSFFENLLSAGSPVVRVMPNTPMLVNAGVCAVCPGRYARPEQVEDVCELLASLGDVIQVKETEMDLVTAVSGSGPAYFFHMVEAMVDAAVGLGLTREMATRLTVGTLSGSAAMLTQTSQSPAQLRESVTSPGGTTAAALRTFEKEGFRTAVYDAMEACMQRSADLRPRDIPAT